MKKLIFISVFVSIISQNALAFKPIKDPLTQLVLLGQSPTQKAIPNVKLHTPTNFILKMVMWGGLNGALLEDGSGLTYVVKEGTKIGNIRVIKILPYKVILMTPKGIKILILKPANNSLTQKPNHSFNSLPMIPVENKNIQNSTNKTISSDNKTSVKEVKP